MNKVIEVSSITVISQAQVLFNHIKGLPPITAHQINGMLQEGYCVFLVVENGQYVDFEVYDKTEVSLTDIEDTGQLVSGTRSDFKDFKKNKFQLEL